MPGDVNKAYMSTMSLFDWLRKNGWPDGEYEFTLLARYKGPDERPRSLIVSSDDLDAAAAALTIQANRDRRGDAAKD